MKNVYKIGVSAFLDEDVDIFLEIDGEKNEFEIRDLAIEAFKRYINSRIEIDYRTYDVIKVNLNNEQNLREYNHFKTFLGDIIL